MQWRITDNYYSFFFLNLDTHAGFLRTFLFARVSFSEKLALALEVVVKTNNRAKVLAGN